MNNLNNKKFLEFKRINHEKIKMKLKQDFIEDLIIREFITIKNKERELVVSQSDFSFYYGFELEYLQEMGVSYVKIIDSDKSINDLYVIEGVLLDENEDIIDRSLIEVLDEYIDLVLHKDYFAPTFKSPCRVYDYYLSEEIFNQ